MKIFVSLIIILNAHFLYAENCINCASHKTKVNTDIHSLNSALADSDWDAYIQKNFWSKGMEKFYIDSKYMGPWMEDTDVVMDKKPEMPNQIIKKKFACKTQKLWPTHPSQATKSYLWGRYSNYKYHDLPPKSYACLMPNPTKKFCLRGAIAKAVVMSDTFQDECGNYYRAYWLVTYFRSDESMGTLYSKGRTAVQNPKSEFKKDFIEDNSYFTQPKDFIMFGELLPGDMKKIQTEKARALKAGFKLNGLEYTR